jgi:hypothetical protein
MNEETVTQSSGTSQTQASDTAAAYIRENFDPNDRVALVLVSRRHGGVVQRITSADRIAAEDFQRWLRFMNARRYEVYLSMNALRPEATGRTKEDIGAVRHIYFDLDNGGPEALNRLLERPDIPKPNYVVQSSPGKYQIIWKAEGFEPEQAEGIQRALVRETGADPAATDSSRVLRIPGFLNHKYDPPHPVTVQKLSDEIHRPDQFPRFTPEQLSPISGERQLPDGHRSQSEKDWAYAMRALARGVPEEKIIAAMAAYRSDKSNPEYYARHTVRKAAASLGQRGQSLSTWRSTERNR